MGMGTWAGIDNSIMRNDCVSFAHKSHAVWAFICIKFLHCCCLLKCQTVLFADDLTKAVECLKVSSDSLALDGNISIIINALNSSDG